MNRSEQIKNCKLHFILSKERTGSSMLATMLNQLDEVFSPSEEPFMLYFHSRYHKVTKWTNKIKKQFLDDFILMHERNIDLYFYPIDIALKNLEDLEEDMSYLEFCKAFYFQFLNGKDKSQVNTIVDKQLKYPFYIPEIQRISPDSKFIFLVRDPRDNVITCQKRKLGRHLNTPYQASYWNNYFSNLTNDRLENVTTFLLVKYENLVNSPEQELKRICTFLNIVYNDNMLNFHASFNNFIDSNKEGVDKEFMHNLKDFHSTLGRPLDPSKIDLWKKEGPIKIQKIEKITSKVASKMGYHIVEPEYNLSFSDKYYIWLGTLQKKWLLKIYLKIPFGVKLWIKKIRSPYRKA